MDIVLDTGIIKGWVYNGFDDDDTGTKLDATMCVQALHRLNWQRV